MKLDDIRAAVEAKYAAVPVELEGGVVNLLNPIRLKAEVRAKLSGLRDAMKADDADPVAILQGVLRDVAETKAQGDRLVKAIGGDAAVLMELFREYNEAVRVGEA